MCEDECPRRKASSLEKDSPLVGVVWLQPGKTSYTLYEDGKDGKSSYYSRQGSRDRTGVPADRVNDADVWKPARIAREHVMLRRLACQ